MAHENIKCLLKDGYPYMIKGNGGHTAVLVGMQPLVGHDYCAIYLYAGGPCVHDLWEIQRFFTVIEQDPPAE